MHGTIKSPTREMSSSNNLFVNWGCSQANHHTHELVYESINDEGISAHFKSLLAWWNAETHCESGRHHEGSDMRCTYNYFTFPLEIWHLLVFSTHFALHPEQAIIMDGLVQPIIQLRTSQYTMGKMSNILRMSSLTITQMWANFASLRRRAFHLGILPCLSSWSIIHMVTYLETERCFKSTPGVYVKPLHVLFGIIAPSRWWGLPTMIDMLIGRYLH